MNITQPFFLFCFFLIRRKSFFFSKVKMQLLVTFGFVRSTFVVVQCHVHIHNNYIVFVHRMPQRNVARFSFSHSCRATKTSTQILSQPAAYLTSACELKKHTVIIGFFFYFFIIIIIKKNDKKKKVFFFPSSDDEETFCRALVEYTRACSHVGYPVREWRDSFPSCSKFNSVTLCSFELVGL